MSEPGLVEILQGIRFLEGITPDELKQLASVARLVKYQPGELIFREGQEVPSVYLVVDGSVSLEICLPGQGCRRLQTVGAGELLGWSSLLGPAPMTATTRAITPARLIALDASQVLALCRFDPKFGFTFMMRTAEALAKRLNATRLQLLDVFRHELPVHPEPGQEASKS